MSGLRETYPLFLANEAQTTDAELEVIDKYSGEVFSRVPLASPLKAPCRVAAPCLPSSATLRGRRMPACPSSL